MEKSQVISTYDVYGKEYSVEVDDLKIAAHVYGLARKGNQILILPAWDGYDFPGGTAMVGETHLETLTREFKEETGYDIKPIRPLEIYTSFFHHHVHNQDFQNYLIYYEVGIIGGELSDAGFDADEKQYAKLAKWVPIESLQAQKYASTPDVAAELIAKLGS